jgi:hypothetical protein
MRIGRGANEIKSSDSDSNQTVNNERIIRSRLRWTEKLQNN